MKSLDPTIIVSIFKNRVREFFNDPLLESTKDAEIAAIAEPTNQEIRNAFVFTTFYVTTIMGIVIALAGPALMQNQMPATFAGMMLLVLPLCLCISVALGFLLVRICGSPVTARRFIGTCILELPVTVSVALVTQIVKWVADITGNFPLALFVPLLTMLTTYRSFVLNRLSRKVSVAVVGGFTILSFLVTCAQVSMKRSMASPVSAAASVCSSSNVNTDNLAIEAVHE